LSSSRGLHPAANVIDPHPSIKRRVQMKIWPGDKVLVTDFIFIP